MAVAGAYQDYLAKSWGPAPRLPDEDVEEGEEGE